MSQTNQIKQTLQNSQNKRVRLGDHTNQDWILKKEKEK
jgi:hypothetical protein